MYVYMLDEHEYTHTHTHTPVSVTKAVSAGIPEHLFTTSMQSHTLSVPI